MEIPDLRSPKAQSLHYIRAEIDERVQDKPTTTCQFPNCTYPAGLKNDRAFVEVDGKPYCDYHYASVKFAEDVEKCKCGEECK